MLLNGSDNEKLYAKLVPVLVKDEYSEEARKSKLFLTMEWEEVASEKYKKVLSITLTDNDDPFFLYILHIGDDDFLKLKRSQHIVSDFSSFPADFIDYIERVIAEDKNPPQDSKSNFALRFHFDEKLKNVAVPTLEVAETSNFKKTVHLFLIFSAATESIIRQHIKSSFRSLKEERRQLQNNLAFMERDLKDKLETRQTMLSSKEQEFEEAVKQLKIELNEKDYKYQRDLQEERDRFNSRHSDEMNRLEKEFKEKECNYNKEIQQCYSRVKDIEILNKELCDRNFKTESEIKELKSKLYTLENEKISLQEKLRSCKHTSDCLESEVEKLQSQLHQLEEKCKKLQQESRSLKESNLKLKDQVNLEIERKKSLEHEYNNIKFRLELTESTKQGLENEKEKLTAVIVASQEKLKELNKEEKNKSHLLTKYKKTLEEKEKQLLNIRQNISELNNELQAKEAEMKYLTESKCTFLKKIDELEKSVIEKEQIIKWLNRQLTINGIASPYNVSSHLITSPSALAQQQLAKISSENSPPLIQMKNPATKSVRIETSPSVYQKGSSTPSQFYKTAGTDSAYCTAALLSNQATPEILAGNHNMNFDPSNFEIDQAALSAAFRNEGTLKHSTAKKPTRPVKSTTPKSSKKR